MSTTALVPLDEYLRATYEPDREYVDGEVVERNVGEKDHSKLQREFVFYFRARQKSLGTHAFPEQRVQVAATRFRIPDVCVCMWTEPDEQIFHSPPFICIEILSKDDTLESLQEKVDDYLAFGVPYVWVINPRSRRAWAYTEGRIEEARDGVLTTENPELRVPLAEVFAGMDE